jgi:hypothetical protein
LRRENYELRRARTRSSRPPACFRDRARRRPTEASAFIDSHRARFGVEPICRVLGVSASAYYQRATGQRSARAIADEQLLERIEEVHVANYFAEHHTSASGARARQPTTGRAGPAPGQVGARRRETTCARSVTSPSRPMRRRRVHMRRRILDLDAAKVVLINSTRHRPAAGGCAGRVRALLRGPRPGG